MGTSIYQRASCPACKAEVALSTAGKLHPHGPRMEPCPASGHTLAELRKVLRDFDKRLTGQS